MTKLFCAASLALALIACNKKRDDAKVGKDAAAAPPADKATPADASAAVPPADNPPPTKPAEAPKAAIDPDCQALADMLGKCTNHEDDIPKVAAQCSSALAKNNVMAPSLRAQIACVKANTVCEPFQKCLAGIK